MGKKRTGESSQGRASGCGHKLCLEWVHNALWSKKRTIIEDHKTENNVLWPQRAAVAEGKRWGGDDVDADAGGTSGGRW